ncbi:hypothetical protein CLU79DRAFT_752806 [Phycomyces nitens]|nr:hypothetical protein CLU79DRAFT_752806 [Phycomyces nitens]
MNPTRNTKNTPKSRLSLASESRHPLISQNRRHTHALDTPPLSRSKSTQSNMNQFVKPILNTNPLPPPSISSPIPHTPQRTTPDQCTVLSGVVAYIDARTDDGDDVTENMERRLESLGAKTRRTFSDSITHLIFKNGSSTILRKARAKKIYIVNLAWITRCRQNKCRMPEKDFPVEGIDNILLTGGVKRRKSMEPGRVRALIMEGSDSQGSTEERTNKRRTMPAHYMVSTLDERLARNSPKPFAGPDPEFLALLEREVEEQEEEANAEKGTDLKRRRLINHKQNSDNAEHSVPEIPLPDPHLLELERAKSEHGRAIRAQIKAEFYIGDITSPKPSRVSLPLTTGPLRRKRRSLGPRLSMGGQQILATLSEQPRFVVFTNISDTEKTQLREILDRLGGFEVEGCVSENTTHVIVGEKRRTQSVTLGIAFHAWLLTPDWLKESAERGAYQKEDDYEAIEYFPRAKASRKREPLFPSNLQVYIISLRVMDRPLAETLIIQGGAKVARNIQDADILITSKTVNIDKDMAIENWLLECIENWQYMPVENYQPSQVKRKV